MSMTSPEDIEKWFEGTQLYDGGEMVDALKKFAEVTQNSRILFNMGCCYLTINDIKSAAENYKNAVKNDQHLAVGYFMVGLTSFLQKEYESAMAAFVKSWELLRGNRCVDYKQLGLNYQLYSCEILSNQAVIAYHLNQFEKAKEYLLEAVGCKAEPRHEATFEMLAALQTGDEIIPYVLPKNRIFRPPKSYVQNLKKKNYLGKATVVTTENEEDIYACFSGIKEEIMKRKREQEANSSKPEDGGMRPRTQAMTRSTMLKDLRKPERKKTLKKTVVKKRQPTVRLGRVIEGPQESNDLLGNKTKIFKPKPRSPCPPRKTSAALKAEYINSRSRSVDSDFSSSTHSTNSERSLSAGDESEYRQRDKSSDSDSEEPTYETVRKTGRRVTDDNSPETVAKAAEKKKYRLSAPDFMFDHRRCLQKPQKMYPTLPMEGRSTLLRKQRSTTIDVFSDVEKRMNLAFVKPLKKPPPLLEAESGQGEDWSSVSSIDQVDSGIDRYSVSSDGHRTSNSDKQEINIRKDSNRKKVKKERKVEVEVQYTFIKKLRIPVGCKLDRLHEIVKNVHIPDQVELCYEDSLGRQRSVSDEDIEGLLFRPSKPQKLLCYPEI